MIELNQAEIQLINHTLEHEGISMLFAGRLGFTEEEVDSLLDKFSRAASKKLEEANESSWLTRLEVEIEDLYGRLWKLYNFNESEAFSKLDSFEQALLSMQYNSMHTYHTVLKILISKAKQNV